MVDTDGSLLVSHPHGQDRDSAVLLRKRSRRSCSIANMVIGSAYNSECVAHAASIDVQSQTEPVGRPPAAPAKHFDVILPCRLSVLGRFQRNPETL